MRIFLGFSNANSIPMTASPSEPILAIVAAQALTKSRDIYRRVIATLLKDLIKPRLVVDEGLPGELYTRMLFILARDEATQPEKFVITDTRTGIERIHAVELRKLLQTLLGPELGLDASQLDLRTRLIEDTSNVWVNFTHFIQLSEIVEEATPTMLLEAWSSFVVYQCAPAQPGISDFIVAYRGDLDKPMDPKNLIMIPWQTKATISTSMTSSPQNLTGPFVIDAGPGGTQIRRKTELLVISMDLDASGRFETGALTDLTYAAAVRPESGKWAGYAREKDLNPERFCLEVRGHGSATYPVINIKDFERDFEKLFQGSLARATHPRLAGSEQEMQAAMQKRQGLR